MNAWRAPEISGRPREFELAVPAVAPESWPDVSACLIVKNEAHNLAACLESLHGLAGEIVVVDTGSSDGTPDLARSLGCRVAHVSWTGDFSAARNASLALATAPWIFWMDADERVGAEAAAQLKAAAAGGAAGAYALSIGSPMPDGSVNFIDGLRLFRNGCGIRFTGAIHESVLPSVVAAGLSLAHTDIVIRHNGYSTTGANDRKARRNLAILNEELQRQPDRLELYFYRGQAFGQLGDTAAAHADLERYLAQTAAGSSFHMLRFWAHAALLEMAERQGTAAEIVAAAERALGEFAHHPHFLSVLARGELKQGQARQALAALTAACRGLTGPVRGLRPGRPALLAAQGECYVALGRRADARSCAQAALAEDPGCVAAAALLARLLDDAGRHDEAARVLAAAGAHATDPNAWLAYGEIQRRQGRAVAQDGPQAAVYGQIKAAQVLQHTRSAGPAAASPAQMQGMALLARGALLPAAEQFAAAIEAEPTNADNYRYLAVALEKLGRHDEALETWQIGQRLKQA